MDRIRLGLQYRALRVRGDLRQHDVGDLARCSRSVVSRIERGLVRNIRLGDLEEVASALGARLDVRLRWHGEALDRLLDQAHAALVDAVVRRLRRGGWDVAVEASFSVWGERGSIDVLAFHGPTGVLLVVEVKSVVPDSQSTLAGLDRKARLAPGLAAARGWRVRHVGRLLVIGDSQTARRRVDEHAATHQAALPARGRVVRRWLAEPDRELAGLMFLSYAPRGSTRGARAWRVRVRRTADRKHTPNRGAPLSRSAYEAER